MNEPTTTDENQSLVVKADNMELTLPKPWNPAAKQVVEQIEKFIAPLPVGADRNQFLHSLVVAANEVDTKYVDNINSVLSACYNACRLNLMPGKALGLAYFVPYGGVCTLIPGFKGYIELAFRNNFLLEVNTELVLDGENFERYNDQDGKKLRHDMEVDRDVSDENILAAYCIYKTVAGGRGLVVMGRKQIDKIKNNALANKKNKGTSPWIKHFDEMALKTVIKNTSKRWVCSKELLRAVYIDEQAERGEQQLCEVSFDGEKTNGNSHKAIDPSDYGDPESQAFTDLKQLIEGLETLNRLNEMDAEIDLMYSENKITVPERESLRAILAGRKKTLENEEN